MFSKRRYKEATVDFNLDQEIILATMYVRVGLLAIVSITSAMASIGAAEVYGSQTFGTQKSKTMLIVLKESETLTMF